MIIFDKVTTDNKRITDEGFLDIGKARIARSGVQEYFAFELGLKDKDPLDVIKIHRPDSEVFKDESMATFAKKPVTNNHPDTMVTVDNVKEFQVGLSGDQVVRDGIFLSTSLLIQDKQAIADINSGKVELSNGYSSEIDFKKGITDKGEEYDGIQKNIRGNHIALVDSARCGVNCRVMDGKMTCNQAMNACLNNDLKLSNLGGLLKNLDKVKLTNTEVNMSKFINIDGIDYEIPDQSKQAVEAKIKALADTIADQADSIEADKKSLSDVEKAKQKELDELQAKLDDALTKIPTPAMLDAIVEARLAVIQVANKVVENFDSSGKDCEKIRLEVVAAKYPSVDFENKSADYIASRFDAIAEDLEQEKENSLKSDLQNFANNQVVDANMARAEMVKRNREAWKTKV